VNTLHEKGKSDKKQAEKEKWDAGKEKLKKERLREQPCIELRLGVQKVR